MWNDTQLTTLLEQVRVGETDPTEALRRLKESARDPDEVPRRGGH